MQHDVQPVEPDHPRLLEFLRACQEGVTATVENVLRDETFDPNSWYDAAMDPRDVGVPSLRTGLDLASEYGQAGIVKILLAEPRVDPNLAFLHTPTPLLTAIVDGRINIVKLLLKDVRVDVNRRCLISRLDLNMSPLFFAIHVGSLQLVELLTRRQDLALSEPQYGMDFSLHFDTGNPKRTPLQLAFQRDDDFEGSIERKRIRELLVFAGATMLPEENYARSRYYQHLRTKYNEYHAQYQEYLKDVGQRKHLLLNRSMKQDAEIGHAVLTSKQGLAANVGGSIFKFLETEVISFVDFCMQRFPKDQRQLRKRKRREINEYTRIHEEQGKEAAHRWWYRNGKRRRRPPLVMEF